MGLLDRPDSDAGFIAGSHRTRAPAETLARLRPRFDDFGITRVANLTGLDRIGLPVVSVCRPAARSSAVFHGKGTSLEAAKASGVMEAVETWFAERPVMSLRHGPAATIRRIGRVADIARLPALAGSANRSLDAAMLWAQAQDLVTGEPVFVPLEIVHVDSTPEAPPASGLFAASTNGLASGNTAAEALVHAICELIERDASSLWHAAPPTRQDACRIDPASVEDATCRGLLQRFAAAGLAVALWQTTTEIGVPAFECTVLDRRVPTDHAGRGAGCHPDSAIALARALCEAAQVRMTYILGAREDLVDDDFEPGTLMRRHRLATARMDRSRASLAFASAAGAALPGPTAELHWLLERLGSAGLKEVLAVDLAPGDPDVAVVRAVVPGLEGSNHHGGYVPGPRARRSAAGAL